MASKKKKASSARPSPSSRSKSQRRKRRKAPGGKTFCITGTLPSGKKKKDYASQLEADGHILIDEVRQGLDYLVVSDPNGAESSKAKKLGIPLITEEEMNARL